MFGLNKEQKEAVGLLSVGTFLEYFDLLLYVHMAVLLNELFFPKFDPHTTSILSSMAFCSTFIFRPVGALIFGWIGDNIGRKSTVIITTMLMAVSCVTMANLPTYEEIGITATWVLLICRIVQGMSSMGEINGAEIYLTESIKPPAQYSAVTLIESFAAMGGMVALAIASIAALYKFNWRIAFWIGALIALIGMIARTRLRETPDFVDMKLKMKKAIELESGAEVAKKFFKDPNNPMKKEKVKKMTALALFLMDCSWPVWFYLAFIYCGNILKDSFGYTPEQVIHQNLIVGITELLGVLPLVYLSYKIYPLIILKIKAVIFSVFILFCPYLLNNVTTPFELLLIQCFIMFFVLDTVPGVAIFYKHFPIFKRFTSVSLLYSLSRAFMYVITSFGFIYLNDHFGHWGLLIIMLPVIIAYIFGLYYFDGLEKENKALLASSKNAFLEKFGSAETTLEKIH